MADAHRGRLVPGNERAGLGGHAGREGAGASGERGGHGAVPGEAPGGGRSAVRGREDSSVAQVCCQSVWEAIESVLLDTELAFFFFVCECFFVFPFCCCVLLMCALEEPVDPKSRVSLDQNDRVLFGIFSGWRAFVSVRPVGCVDILDERSEGEPKTRSRRSALAMKSRVTLTCPHTRNSGRLRLECMCFRLVSQGPFTHEGDGSCIAIQIARRCVRSSQTGFWLLARVQQIPIWCPARIACASRGTQHAVKMRVFFNRGAK